jgi:PLP dependent protein
MNNISQNITELLESLPEGVMLVAVSKTKAPEAIMEAYNAGQRVFGENRVQELAEKYPLLPGDIQWHMIGHLQRNKVKQIAGFVSLIHSVDSFRLLDTINAEAEKAGRTINCLLQFHIAEEETKYGLSMEEATALIGNVEQNGLNNVVICGVMGMATFTENGEQVRKEFSYLKKCFDNLKNMHFRENSEFKHISMGMSGDFKIAIEEGSTMVRIGSSIFGEREKNE